MTETIFQPFSDRLSRDIRNDLSRSFAAAIQQETMEPAYQTADKYLASNLSPLYTQYIKSRLTSYSTCLKKIVGGEKDPLWQSLVLWDEQLFFEVHEILEHAWMQVRGKEKLFLQAMIRAAGVYIKIDAGYKDPAGKMAAKAIPILEENRKRLSQYTNPDRLISALRSLAVPPQLLGEFFSC